ncbi:hypothetical protein MCEMSEM18_02220 [Comamonadaceae bacterium]
MPIMSAPQGWLLGGEFVVKGLIAFPLAIIFSPFLALAPLTNVIFLANLSRLWSRGTSKPANVVWVGGALVFNCFAILVGNSIDSPVLGDIDRYPAMWLWLLSFVLLCLAITRSELRQTKEHSGVLKDRWKLAIALSCVLSLAGLTVRTVMFPGPTINRTVTGVEGIEIRRSGVPPTRYPLLEDGYLRQSKYKFFVLDGYAHEPLLGGGWITRPGANPVRHVVHETVESFELSSRGPGAVLRSTMTVYDGGELIARKTVYEGMEEGGNGIEGAIALNFVQSVLQPAPSSAPSAIQRQELTVHPLDLPKDLKLSDTKRHLIGCPSSVALNPNNWRELRASKWSLYALINISGVACDQDSIVVVMCSESVVYVDVISLGGQVVSQFRASTSHRTNLYAMEEARASKDGWRIRLVSWRPGPSINVPTVPLERFEIALESNKPN